MHTQENIPFRVERLLSLPYYAEHVGQSFSDQHSAYMHFVHYGQPAGVNPSPFFYTKWYAWQHADTQSFPSVLDHFVHHGAQAPIDPAPFIDAVALLSEYTAYPTILDALLALTEGREHAISPLFEDHLAQLAARQAHVHSNIHSRYIRKCPTARRRLVWVQAGPRFSTTQWFRPDSPRQWDLMCNWYMQGGLDLRHGEIHLLQPGTKCTAMHHVLQHDPDLLSGYDQLLFLDDDLTVAHEDIDLLFDMAERDNLALFQASLSPGSYGVWTDLVQQAPQGSRLTTGVEIMMPGFTRDALFLCKDILGRSISGYGLDFLFSEHIRRHGGRCGVVDAVSVRHTASIDEQNGAYYQLMRDLGIRHKLELSAIIHELGKFPDFSTL